MKLFVVYQHSDKSGSKKTFLRYTKALAQWRLWNAHSWNSYTKRVPGYYTEEDGLFRPNSAKFPLISEVEPEPPRLKSVSEKAVMRGKKPSKQRAIVGGTPIGHPYVPLPEEIIYPDEAIIRTK